MPSPLKSYHLAWLAAHSYRSEEWLRAHLADGFDVHHADGSKANEEPSNLILIEHGDHLRLHGMPIGELPKITGRRGGLARANAMTKQERIMAAMRASNVRWRKRKAKLAPQQDVKK